MVYQPASGKPYKEPTIIVKGKRLHVVDKFTYLGSTFSGVIHIDHEVNARIAKASAAFCRLRGSIWDRNQTRLYCTDLYCSQHYYTQVKLGQFYQRHAKRLNHFHTRCLRKPLKWQGRIPDTEVLKRTGMQSVHILWKLRWTGHVTRMPDERLPKKILKGELQVGKSSHGGQKTRNKDTLKASLKDFNIPTESGNRLHRIEQSGKASKRGVLMSTKRKESAKPSRNVHSGKPELRHHQQSSLPQTALVLSATGSLELRLVSSAIFEHTNNNTSRISLGLVNVSNDRRTTRELAASDLALHCLPLSHCSDTRHHWWIKWTRTVKQTPKGSDGCTVKPV